MMKSDPFTGGDQMASRSRYTCTTDQLLRAQVWVESYTDDRDEIRQVMQMLAQPPRTTSGKQRISA